MAISELSLEQMQEIRREYGLAMSGIHEMDPDEVLDDQIIKMDADERSFFGDDFDPRSF